MKKIENIIILIYLLSKYIIMNSICTYRLCCDQQKLTHITIQSPTMPKHTVAKPLCVFDAHIARDRLKEENKSLNSKLIQIANQINEATKQKEELEILIASLGVQTSALNSKYQENGHNIKYIDMVSETLKQQEADASYVHKCKDYLIEYIKFELESDDPVQNPYVPVQNPDDPVQNPDVPVQNPDVNLNNFFQGAIVFLQIPVKFPLMLPNATIITDAIFSKLNSQEIKSLAHYIKACELLDEEMPTDSDCYVDEWVQSSTYDYVYDQANHRFYNGLLVSDIHESYYRKYAFVLSELESISLSSTIDNLISYQRL